MRADKFLYMSNVQLEKQSWQMRNRIRTQNGWDYIGVPILIKGRSEQKICDAEIDNSTNWRLKTQNVIQMNYAKTPYYQDYQDFIADLYARKWEKLNDIDIYIMNFILDELNVNTEILYDTDYKFEGQKTLLLVDYCKKLNCDVYMSNLGSAAYVQIPEFNQAK